MEITLGNTKAFAQGFGDNTNLLDVLKLLIEEYNYTRVSVCSAYVSYRGLILVRSLLSNNGNFRWIFGLDDAFTQPTAFTIAQQTHNSILQVAEMQTAHRRGRFHPKVYLFDANENNDATLIIGSSNMTESALTKNCEAFTVIQATTEQEANQFQNFWGTLWNGSRPLTPELLESYKQRFNKKKAQNPLEKEEKITANPSPVLRKATKEIVKSSSLVWTEIGNMTGGNRQVEIVKALAPLLNLPTNPAEDQSVDFPFQSPNGNLQFRITYHHGIWRFYNLQQGFTEPLRPDGTTSSPYMLVIERSINDEFSMRLLNLKSGEAKQIKKKSNELGFSGKTRVRNYGWL